MLKQKSMDDPVHLPHKINAWIYLNIKKPIAGFEHKKNLQGEEIGLEDQIKATHYQIELVALSYLSHGKSEEEILRRLRWFT